MDKLHQAYDSDKLINYHDVFDSGNDFTEDSDTDSNRDSSSDSEYD